MRSKQAKAVQQQQATEEAMRAAFERLKLGAPIRSPIWTKVTQNNVAREAGFSPSALRKERYAVLISEIQQYGKSAKEAPAQPVPAAPLRVSPKIVDVSRMLSLLAEVAELRKKVRELQAIIKSQNS